MRCPPYVRSTKDMKTHEWVKLRKKLLERFDYTCQICGNEYRPPKDEMDRVLNKDNSRFLIVHHIIPFFISFDNSEDNLMVVCRKCHWKLHNKKVIK